MAWLDRRATQDRKVPWVSRVSKDLLEQPVRQVRRVSLATLVIKALREILVHKDLREYPEILDPQDLSDPLDKMDLQDSQEQSDQRVAPEALVVKVLEDWQVYREQLELQVPEVTPDLWVHLAIQEELEQPDQKEPADQLDRLVISDLLASWAHRVFQELLDQLGQLALLGSEERTVIPVRPEHLVFRDLQDLSDNLDHMVLLDQRETRELLAQLVHLGQVAIRVHRASEDPRVLLEQLGLQDHKDPRALRDFKGPAVIQASPDQLAPWDPVDLLAQ